jgi:hypothetical protein
LAREIYEIRLWIALWIARKSRLMVRNHHADIVDVRVARFRRQGKLIHAQRADWDQWLAQQALDISVAELPESVLETEISWWYLLD